MKTPKGKCPDCEKVLKKDDTTYGIYRSRYIEKDNPQGHLYVCAKCYKGSIGFK